MTNSKILVALSALLAGVSLAVGCSSRGSSGATGPVGPVGPLDSPPQITSVYPTSITAATNFHVKGTGFVGTAGEIVLVNGYPATILSATSTDIWATGASYSSGDYVADVTVQANGRYSNSFPIYFGTRGDSVIAPVVAPYEFLSGVLDSSGAAAFLGDSYGVEVGPDYNSDDAGII